MIESNKIRISGNAKKFYKCHKTEVQNPIVKVAVFTLNLPWTLCGLLLGLLSFPVGIKIEENGFLIVMKVKRIWLNEIFMRDRVVGATAGSLILLSDKAEKFTRAHERIHVRQFETKPFFFPVLYCVELIRHGYFKNKYEEEAYWLSHQSV